MSNGYQSEFSLNQTDPSQNFVDRYPQPLDPLFYPKTIALIGAKDDIGSVSRTILLNLMSNSFQGKIYPINPKRQKVLELKCYPSIKNIEDPIDLAIIVTPAMTVPNLIKECVLCGVKTAMIISAGFKELGDEGLKLEQEIVSIARQARMPIIGPNCLGIMNPIYGLNSTFAKRMALPGHLAFISQSGAMCTAVLDWSIKEKVGFSAFISIGSMADVNWGNLIDYLGSDPNTHSLLLYMETVGDARAFMTAAREVALEKPIIVIKPGRSSAAAKAAASHTGSLAGSDEVFDAALERIGVLRVNTISELFSMASVLDKQPRPKGPCLTIVTNAGGPAVLATDAVVMNDAELTPLSKEMEERLNQILPPAWSHSNPIDILGDASPDRYVNTIDLLSRDEKSHGLLIILSPQDMTDATEVARQLKKSLKTQNKPILASWMGAETVEEGKEILSDARIPVFEYPDDAAKTFAMMWKYSQNLQALYEFPTFTEKLSRPSSHAIESVKSLFHKMNQRVLLTEFESKEILKYYQIPVVETKVARTVEEAVSLSESFGYPIVLKLFSETITHKTDVGGVKLDLKNPGEVQKAFYSIQESVTKSVGLEHFQGVVVQKMIKQKGYELILGSSTDSQFGPILLFGMGGQLVEVFKDRALALPPLNSVLARKLIEKTKIYQALIGVRGQKGVKIDQLVEILVKFSELIMENPRIKECDINPLLVSEEEIIALDARIVLHDPLIADEELPRLAIRPYPHQYCTSIKLKNELHVNLRPILPEDSSLLIEFHHSLSAESVRQRFFEFVALDQRVAHERLVRICFNDYDREWALVAEIENDKKRKIIGVGRLLRIPGTDQSQFKLIIADGYHRLGLGSKILSKLLDIAKNEKITSVNGYILDENYGMLKICQDLNFNLEKKDRIWHAHWIN